MNAVEPAASRKNNLALFRVLLASLVVVSHSPELIDGNRSREPLTRLFGTLSLGEVAVDGFFLISGYLITASYLRPGTLLGFLKKRIFRIYPGYLVNFWLCVLLLAPAVGASMNVYAPAFLAHSAVQSLMLGKPQAPNVFQSLPYPILNGAVWTIKYEFLCYLATALLGFFGLLQRRQWLIALGAVLLLAVNGYNTRCDMDATECLWGLPKNFPRFAAVYAVGAVFYLFKHRVPVNGYGALLATVALVLLFGRPLLAEAAFAVFGGYLIFWAALQLPALAVSQVLQRFDVSYGLYLYAWPIQSTIIYVWPGVGPWTVCVVALAGAGLCASASWIWIERPALRLAHEGLAGRRR